MDSAHSVWVHDEKELASPDVGEDTVTGLSDSVATPSGHFLSVNLPKLSPAQIDGSTEKDMLPFVSPPSSPRSRPKRVTDAPKKKRNTNVEKCRRNLSDNGDFRKNWMKRMAHYSSTELAVSANIKHVPRCGLKIPAYRRRSV